jgi:hypothetical protein
MCRPRALHLLPAEAGGESEHGRARCDPGAAVACPRWQGGGTRTIRPAEARSAARHPRRHDGALVRSTPAGTPWPRSTDRYPRGPSAFTLRGWSAAPLPSAPPRRGPVYWSAVLSPVPTRPAPSDIGAPPPAPRMPGDVAAAGDDAGLTHRELLMEMREHIKGIRATVDAIARDQAPGVERWAAMQRRGSGRSPTARSDPLSCAGTPPTGRPDGQDNRNRAESAGGMGAAVDQLVGARGVERVELISSANVSGLHQSGPQIAAGRLPADLHEASIRLARGRGAGAELMSRRSHSLLQAVEDQVQAVIELVPVVVAGPHR